MTTRAPERDTGAMVERPPEWCPSFTVHHDGDGNETWASKRLHCDVCGEEPDMAPYAVACRNCGAWFCHPDCAVVHECPRANH